VLPLITSEFGLSAIQEGLIGAASLAGIFFGAPMFGYLTDRFGRRKIFIFDLIAFVIIGALQAVVGNNAELLVLRFLLGLAIGAEYAIGQTMLAEFVPSSGRGTRLASLQASWYGGFLLAVIIAFTLDGLGVDWRWILATGAIPGLGTLLLRQGLPESPRWLVSVGRDDEAREIVDEHLGSTYYSDEDLDEESEDTARFRDLFAKDKWRSTAFASIFFTCLVAPYFAIFTFAPTVLESLRLANPAAGTIALNATAALGALVGMLTIERVGRRVQLIPSFWVMTVALAVIGLWSGAPAMLVVLLFAVFSFFNALQGNLTAVYPIEILPTEVRSSGVGVAAAFSRVAAAAGTFLLPLGITSLGTGTCMLIAAGVCVVGAVVSHAMAPETTGRALHETSRSPLVAAVG
jgi:MFS transporter, putative metabolite transport protein